MNHQLNPQHTVREAVPADVPRITEVWLEGVVSAFGGNPAPLPPRDVIDAQMLKLVLQQTDNFKFWLCVNANGTIVGWTTIQPFHTTPWEEMRNLFGFMSTFFCNEGRGHGLGSLLTQFAIDYCREHTKIAWVIGMQDKANTPSVLMTRNAGFHDMGNLPHVDGLIDIGLVIAKTK